MDNMDYFNDVYVSALIMLGSLLSMGGSESF